MSKETYIVFYHKIVPIAYKILEDWKEDMSKLSDRDKHLIDAFIRASWEHKTHES